MTPKLFGIDGACPRSKPRAFDRHWSASIRLRCAKAFRQEALGENESQRLATISAPTSVGVTLNSVMMTDMPIDGQRRNRRPIGLNGRRA